VATGAWRISGSEETCTFALLVILLGDEDGGAFSTHEINKNFHILHCVHCKVMLQFKLTNAHNFIKIK